MKDIKFLFALVCLLLVQFSVAKESTIRGTIIDDENAEPLFAATVGVTGTNIGASSDFDGNFELKIKPGSYTISFSFIGYQTLVITDVTVQNNEIKNLGTIRLKSSSIVVDAVTITAEAIKNTETALLTIKKKIGKRY